MDTRPQVVQSSRTRIEWPVPGSRNTARLLRATSGIQTPCHGQLIQSRLVNSATGKVIRKPFLDAPAALPGLSVPLCAGQERGTSIGKQPRHPVETRQKEHLVLRMEKYIGHRERRVQLPQFARDFRSQIPGTSVVLVTQDEQRACVGLGFPDELDAFPDSTPWRSRRPAPRFPLVQILPAQRRGPWIVAFGRLAQPDNEVLCRLHFTMAFHQDVTLGHVNQSGPNGRPSWSSPAIIISPRVRSWSRTAFLCGADSLPTEVTPSLRCTTKTLLSSRSK